MALEQSGTLGDRLKSTRAEAGAVRDDVAEIAGELRRLLQLQTELARAEVDEARQHATRGAAMGAGAAIIAFIGVFFGFLTLMLVLDTFMPAWLAALITTVAIVAIVAVLGLGARQEARSFSPVPRRFLKSLREDVEWAKAQTRSNAT